MTIQNTTSRKEYAGDGSTTAFAFPYYFLANADLVVTLRDNATGAETAQVLDTDYSVSGAGLAAGGTVTMTAAPASGKTLIIRRSPSLTQSTDFVPNDELPAETLEAAFDRLVMLIQSLDERVDRCLKFPMTDASSLDSHIPSSVTRASKVLGFDASGNPVATTAPTADTSALVVVSASDPGHVNGRLWVDTSTAGHLIVKQSDGTDWTQAWDYDTAANTVTVGIGNDSITNAKLANVASGTIKGRTTAGAGDPEDLTGAQATALLNAFTGDSGAGGVKGLVPAPAAGDAAAGKFLKADGTWTAPSGSTITGEIRMYAGAVAPSGWLLCDGAAISRTTYASLFAVTGTIYGAGDGSTTFNIPDLRGRAPIGAGTGAGLTARSLGQLVGEETHVLTTNEMPSHTHGVKVHSSPPNATAVATGYLAAGTNFQNTTTTTNTNMGASAGSGAAHNNMQPSSVVNFIIKT
ncbi:MAG: tail fiber protein [Pseudomonadota bacterium]